MKNITIAFCLWFFLNPCFGQKETSSLPPDVAVMINDHAITKTQAYNLFAKRYKKETREIIRELAVHWIIRREYKKEGIKVLFKDIKEKSKQELKRSKKYVKEKLQLSWKQYLAKLKVTEKSLYKSILEKWKYKLVLEQLVVLNQIRQTRILARHIMVKDKKKAEKLLQKIKNGASFARIAQTDSISSTRRVGGKLPILHRGDVHKSLENVIFKLPKGKLSEIVKSPWGYHIVEVLQIYPGTPKAKWQSVKTDIQEYLKKQRVTPKDIQRWIGNMRKIYKLRY